MSSDHTPSVYISLNSNQSCSNLEGKLSSHDISNNNLPDKVSPQKCDDVKSDDATVTAPTPATSSSGANDAILTSTPHVFAHVIGSDDAIGGSVRKREKLMSVGGISNIPPKILVTSATRSINNLASKSTSSCPRSDSKFDMTTRSIRDVIDVTNGMTISYHDVTYSVDMVPSVMDAVKDCCSERPNYSPPSHNKGYKRILRGLSGIFPPGLNAIMGPSGSGKSSLLEIISGRQDRKTFQGLRLVNEQPMAEHFARLVGFTSQDDILNPNLTVREHLYYALVLRGRGSLNVAEQLSRLEELINDLGLKSCENVKVGDWSSRTISGGERRRTAIGMEMVAAPKILFLDEPTSKLDSTTSRSIVRILKKLADKGRTVVITIHQPSYAIYRMFDTLTLVAQGSTIYHGKADKALEYFDKIGYKCEKFESPPNFFIDILFSASLSPSSVLATPRNRSARSHSLRRSAMRNHMVTLSPYDVFNATGVSSPTAFSNAMDITTVEGAKEHVEIVKRFRQAYSKSALRQKNKLLLEKIRRKALVKDFLTELEGHRRLPFLTELTTLTHRTLKCSQRTFIAITLMNLVVGLLFGVLYFQRDGKESSVQNRLGMFFYLSVHGVMVPAMITAKSFVVNEKPLYIHERKSGMYSAVTYCLARLCLILCTRAMSAAVFSCVVYWATGLRNDSNAFLFFAWTSFSSGIACDALCLLAAVAFSSFNTGRTFIVLYMSLTAVFAGYLLDLESAFPWLSWVKYVSITRYCYLAWVLNEYSGAFPVPCPGMVTPARKTHAVKVMSRIANVGKTGRFKLNVTTCTFKPGDSLLPQVVGKDQFLMTSPWLNNAIMISMATLLFLLSFRQMSKLK